MLYQLFSRWGNWCTEGLSNLLKITSLISGGVWMQPYQKIPLSQKLFHNLLCLYLISHNFLISIVQLGWSYGYAHHFLINLSSLLTDSFIQQIFTEFLPQVYMPSRWHNQECSLLSPLLQILPFGALLQTFPFIHPSLANAAGMASLSVNAKGTEGHGII